MQWEISGLSKAWTKLFMIETRFQRLQESLRVAYKSLYFSLIAPTLILSDFNFTVLSISSSGNQDRFYEPVTAWTLPTPSSSPWARPAHSQRISSV